MSATLSTTYVDFEPASATGSDRRLLEAMALGLVWLAVAAGAVVLTEPAPVDVLTLGLLGVLPLLRLVQVTPTLRIYLAAWLVSAAGALVASAQSYDMATSATHSAVSIYLYVSSFVFAAFIARRPERHIRLVMHAYVAAALLAGAAGVAGYFDLFPGAGELLTKFGRASGTFKDPNVFGPFLVPAIVYLLHLAMSRPPLRAVMPFVLLLFLVFAELLSFSRGAWLNLGLAGAIYCYLSFVTAAAHRQRVKLIALALAGAIAMAGLIAVALQFDAISELFSERAALTQSYDEGPEGRFGGQEKALDLAITNPLGLGALQFGQRYHHEDAHNVYVSMFLNAGWLGGLSYLLIVGVTLIHGLRAALRNGRSRPVFLVVYASLVAIVVQGAVIDTDHWRHFYLLMAMVWGLAAGDRLLGTRVASRPIPPRPAMVMRPGRPARRLVSVQKRPYSDEPPAAPAGSVSSRRKPTIKR